VCMCEFACGCLCVLCCKEKRVGLCAKCVLFIQSYCAHKRDSAAYIQSIVWYMYVKHANMQVCMSASLCRFVNAIR